MSGRDVPVWKKTVVLFYGILIAKTICNTRMVWRGLICNGEGILRNIVVCHMMSVFGEFGRNAGSFQQ